MDINNIAIISAYAGAVAGVGRFWYVAMQSPTDRNTDIFLAVDYAIVGAVGAAATATALHKMFPQYANTIICGSIFANSIRRILTS